MNLFTESMLDRTQVTHISFTLLQNENEHTEYGVGAQILDEGSYSNGEYVCNANVCGVYVKVPEHKSIRSVLFAALSKLVEKVPSHKKLIVIKGDHPSLKCDTALKGWLVEILTLQTGTPTEVSYSPFVVEDTIVDFQRPAFTALKNQCDCEELIDLIELHYKMEEEYENETINRS